MSRPTTAPFVTALLISVAAATTACSAPAADVGQQEEQLQESSAFEPCWAPTFDSSGEALTAFSPDGKRVTYVTCPDGPDGSESLVTKSLVTGATRVLGAVSHAKRLSLLGDHRVGVTTSAPSMVVADLSGTFSQELSAPELFAPIVRTPLFSVSPTGDRVAVVSQDAAPGGKLRLTVKALDATEAVSFTAELNGPSYLESVDGVYFAPDGKSVAVTRASDVVRLDLVAGALAYVAFGGHGDSYYDGAGFAHTWANTAFEHTNERFYGYSSLVGDPAWGGADFDHRFDPAGQKRPQYCGLTRAGSTYAALTAPLQPLMNGRGSRKVSLSVWDSATGKADAPFSFTFDEGDDIACPKLSSSGEYAYFTMTDLDADQHGSLYNVTVLVSLATKHVTILPLFAQTHVVAGARRFAWFDERARVATIVDPADGSSIALSIAADALGITYAEDANIRDALFLGDDLVLGGAVGAGPDGYLWRSSPHGFERVFAGAFHPGAMQALPGGGGVAVIGYPAKMFHIARF
jgi:hypothetical protein